MDGQKLSELIPHGAHVLQPQTRESVPTQEVVYKLADLQRDYHFFNHGAFFAPGLFAADADPVWDWWAQQSEAVEVVKQAYEKDIFSGLDALTFENRVPWNRVICAVRHEEWPSLLEYLAGICIHDPRKEEVFLAYFADVDVLDPAEVDRRGLLYGGLQLVPVTVFCVDGSRVRYEFQRVLPHTVPPRLVARPPREYMQQLGSLVVRKNMDWLADRHNPAFAEFLQKYQASLRHGISGEASADRRLFTE
jgi:hypothetical protein